MQIIQCFNGSEIKCMNHKYFELIILIVYKFLCIIDQRLEKQTAAKEEMEQNLYSKVGICFTYSFNYQILCYW